ncbi:hypothetical protein D3C72_1893310 [compost metagenome]
MTPKRSLTMPNCSAKKVLSSGITTWPPSFRPLKAFSTPALSAKLTVRPKPSNLGWFEQRPSEAMITLSPTWNSMCMTLSSVPGGGWQPGSAFWGSGLSLNDIRILTLAPRVFL